MVFFIDFKIYLNEFIHHDALMDDFYMRKNILYACWQNTFVHHK